MSFDRNNPDHCPTCDTCQPCVHRATRSAHVAYREGRDAFNIPWSNRTPIDEIDRTCMYPEGTDDASWWQRGFQSEARMAVASERRTTIVDLCKRVGVLLAHEHVVDGTMIVEAKIADRWWQYAADGAQGAISDRTWNAPGCRPGWSLWDAGPVASCELAARGRLVPVGDADQPPDARGEIA